MKSFFARLLSVAVLSTTVLSMSAQADVLVAHDAKAALRDLVGVSYDYNPTLGRAWVNLEYYDSDCVNGSGGACTSQVFVRAQVNGLVFDGALGEAVFTDVDGSKVVCARVAKHWYGTDFRSTGLCGLTRTVETAELDDDGYETHEVAYLDHYFGKVAHPRSGD